MYADQCEDVYVSVYDVEMMTHDAHTARSLRSRGIVCDTICVLVDLGREDRNHITFLYTLSSGVAKHSASVTINHIQVNCGSMLDGNTLT